MKIVSRINDSTNICVGFITEYPDNAYIEKTVVYGLKMSETFKIIHEGKIIVVLRNGKQYEFNCWASTSYCGQFGISVSDDGEFIYLISDEVGLWCYTYKGEIVWKTRYTSIGHVIVNANCTITCITSTSLLVINQYGKTVKKRKICHYHADRASDNMIYAAITENVRALIDCETLDVLWQSSLKSLDILQKKNFVKTRFSVLSCVN